MSGRRAPQSRFTAPQSKPDVSDFDDLMMPNSGKPEFGWERGRRSIRGSAAFLQ